MNTSKNNEQEERAQKNSWSVYMHINKINNKKYVGITKQKPQRRWKNGWGYYSKTNQSYFWKAIKKYGWNNFEHVILEDNLSFEQAKATERYYIKLYNASNNLCGYNLTLGGDGFLGMHRSEQTKMKISKSLRGKYTKEKSYWYGKHIPQEVIKKQKETKRRHPYHHTEEWKKNHSNQLKGANNSNAIKVKCITTNMTFDCIKDAASYYNVDNSRIGKCCKGLCKSAGKHPKTGEKLLWKYTV